ncbi:NUDIX hydrolase [Clostridium oryzae]|uniref:Isopentenyl-diphosphate delta-isomerase n=1 Tax=Clostridium oryzae TaxID=1450648 RepID=A0A1V4IQX7_9CLOT|nr:NUDIX domain-containing protein [Clostridium oryzae]OPJ62438.1 isopentenyl-diphosphate delta-isomerase [Clostridium oryzae]
MKEEYIDVFDENFNLIGCQPREEIHKNGYWHQTFHCWVIHKTDKMDYLVFQLRQDNKDNFPNCYDVTSAGHLQAGENPEDGVREIKEELGLEIDISDLKKIGVVKCENINGGYIDREFQHVYLYVSRKPIAEYKLEYSEVKGLIEIPLPEAKKFLYGTLSSVNCHGYELDTELNKNFKTYELTKDRFVGYPKDYIDKIFKENK